MGCISPNPLNTNPESSSAIPASDLGMSADFADPKTSPSVENATKDHETKDCTADETEYKCYHCSKTDHITGSHTCHIVKEKLQELLDRQNG